MERKRLKDGDIIRNILNIDTRIIPYELQYANIGCETNVIELSLYVDKITNPYLEITKTDGAVVNTDILPIEDNFIKYSIPFNYYASKGKMLIRMRSDEIEGQYINLVILDNLKTSDNIIVKIENNEYLIKAVSTELSSKEIVSSGSSYIKYSEGTMICRGRITVPRKASGGQDITVNLPADFIDNDYDVTLGILVGGSYWSWLRYSVASRTTNQMTIQSWNDTTNTIEETILSYIAMGRWK